MLVFWVDSDEISEWATDGADVFERATGAVDVDYRPTAPRLRCAEGC